jgi:putative ABC transport system permease protein
VTRGPFWLRSVRRRPSAFVSLFVLAAIAVAVSVLAPIMLRSLQQQTLADAIGPAGGSRSTIVTSADGQGGDMSTGLSGAIVLATAARGSGLWTAPIAGVQSGLALPWETETSPAPAPGTPAPTTSLVGVSHGCGGATFVQGRCPQAVGEVAVSRTAAEPAIKQSPATQTPGQQAGLGLGTALTVGAGNNLMQLEVVGVYDDRGLTGRFFANPASASGVAGAASDPSFLVPLAQFDTLSLEGRGYALIALRHVLRLDDVDQVRVDIAAAQDATQNSEGASGNARVSTGILNVLDRIGPQHEAAAVLIAVVTLEALALAWFTVALAVQRIGRVRASEWGLARLRGLPRRRWLGAVFLEPSIALIAGAVVGFALGIGLALLGSDVLLGPAAPVEPFRPLVYAAAGLSLAGALLALLAASLRSARLPLSALLRETTEPRRMSRLSLVGQTGILVVTVLVVYSLTSQSQIQGPQLALLAPSLIAVVVGIVGVQVAVAVIRRVARRAPRSLEGLVIGRQLGRAPSVLFAAVMVSLGLSVATYSAQVAVTAIRLQDNRAAAVVGASTVLSVQVPDDVSLLAAVRRADPSGKQAMAAEVSTTGNGVGRFVAVDSSRLGAVSSWDSAWSGLDTGALRAALAPPTTAPFEVRGKSLRLTIAGAEGKDGFDLSTLHFEVVVQAADGLHTITFGSPRDGTVVSSPGDFPCADGCRVAWIGELSSQAEAPTFSAELTVTSFATDVQPASELAGWLDPARWRNRLGATNDSQHPPTATRSDGAAGPAATHGLRILFTDNLGSNTVSVAPRDAPEPLPALLGAKTTAIAFPGLADTVQGVAPDLSPRLLRVIGRVPALPQVLDTGVLVDLESVQRVSDSGSSVADHEVWLAPGAHPAVLAALKSDGITVTGTRTLASEQTEDAREAPPRAAVAGLPVAAAALLLTLMAVIALRIVGSRARRADWQSLRTAGVPQRRLRRLLALETFVPPAAGAVLGVGSGLLAFAVTVGRLPLLAGAGPTPPPSYAVAVLPVVLLVVGELLLLAAVAVVGARLELPTGRGARRGSGRAAGRAARRAAGRAARRPAGRPAGRDDGSPR